MRSSLPMVALVAGAVGVHAQSSTVLRTCPSAGLCYALNIPDSSASSGSGSIYFQLTSPTTNSWAALAQGTRMSNANIFVMYQSADGKNVTVSPRTAPGHVMPRRSTSGGARITLLAGSGVQDGVMTANVRCDNCQSWSGGTLDYKGSSSGWMYAIQAGDPIKSDDLDETISQHSTHGNFQFATAQAVGGADQNPFVETSTSNGSGSGSGTSSSSSPSASASGTSGGTSGGNTITTTPSGSTSGSGYSAMSPEAQRRILLVHGSLATIAFVALFPLGAVLMRAGGLGRARVWAHGGTQLLAYAVFIAAAGLGIYMARGLDDLSQPHAIIGLVLLSLIFFLPFFGHAHHLLFKKHGTRSLLGHAHANMGRAIILLGIINGGLGLQLASAGMAAVIAYGVIAGLVGVVYIAFAIFTEVRIASSASKPPAEKRLNGKGSDTELVEKDRV